MPDSHLQARVNLVAGRKRKKRKARGRLTCGAAIFTLISIIRLLDQSLKSFTVRLSTTTRRRVD